MMDQEQYLNPEATFLDPHEHKAMQEIVHLRAAGLHWQARALQAEARCDELQRRWNEHLAAEAEDLPSVFANCDR